MQIVFHLLYSQYGGSGIHGLTYRDVMDMEVVEILWFYERLCEAREAEADALKKR